MTRMLAPLLKCTLDIIPTPPPLDALQQENLDKFRNMKPWLYLTSSVSHPLPEDVVYSGFEEAEYADNPIYSDIAYWSKDFELFCTEECLCRYLRAHNWNVLKACDGLWLTLQWRRRFQPHRILPAAVENESRTGKMYINGFDVCGRPIVYIRPHLENSKNAKSQTRCASLGSTSIHSDTRVFECF